MSNWISPARFGLSRRGAWLRAAVPCLVFLVGFAALAFGAGVSERAIPQHPLHWIYYTLGLFVLGGLDLGTPDKGPAWAQTLLWSAFFAAPAVTASALLEVLWLVALPVAYRLRRLRDHTVLVGSGRLAELYLQRLRAVSPGARVLLVERNPAEARLEALAAKYPITVVTGDINNDPTLAILQLQRARRVVLLTGSDLTNLNAAYQILERAPLLAGRIVLHLGNLGLLHTVHLTRAVQASAFFNSHEISARRLVSAHLLERFARTERADLVVLVGFGRFGQCVLHALQEQAQGKFEEVLILDVSVQARVSAFEDRVGFAPGYARHAVHANVLNSEIWAQLERDHQLAQREPLIILGVHDDMVNLEAALWLRRRYPAAYIVVRQFNRSTFSVELARERSLLLFSVAELITEAIPSDWCVKPRALGA